MGGTPAAAVVPTTYIIHSGLQRKRSLTVPTESARPLCRLLKSSARVCKANSMLRNFFLWLRKHVQPWIQPASLLPGILSDLPRDRSDLIAENAILRQPLILLNRQVKKPVVTKADRFWFVLSSHFTTSRKQSFHIVQPDNLLRQHRKLFRIYWHHKSQSRLKLSSETVALIRKLGKREYLVGSQSNSWRIT